LASFLVGTSLAVDAGSLTSELTLDEQKEIGTVLVSHGHYDHIRAVPTFAFGNMGRTIRVVSAPETLEILSSHLMDGIIYPKFASEDSFLKRPVVELISIRPHESLVLEGYKVTAKPVQHPRGAIGFAISGDGGEIFYTGDTGPGLAGIWSEVNPQLLIIETTMPNRFEDIARNAEHLCPRTLMAELIQFQRVKGYLPRVAVVHMSPRLESEIRQEIGLVEQQIGTTIRCVTEGDILTL
jgi:Cft2 family RNA processing exonuclease